MLIKNNVCERILKPVRNFLFLHCTGDALKHSLKISYRFKFPGKKKDCSYILLCIGFVIVRFSLQTKKESSFEMVYHRNIGQLMHNNWAAMKRYFLGDLWESIFLLSWKPILLPECDSFALKTLNVTMVWCLSSYTYYATHL